MLRLKVCRKLKGNIALYVLYWGILCISMVVLGFSLEAERRKNIGNLKRQIESSDYRNMHREELFSDFYERLIQSNIPIVQEKIDQFITENVNNLALTRDGGKLYFRGDKILILTYRDEDSNNVFECYKVKEVNGRLRFMKVQGGFLYYNYDL